MSDLAKAIAVTAELCGTQLSEAAGEMLATELAMYPSEQVLGALKRCRRELKSRLTMAAVIERLEDGRPGAEEAWAMLPRDEAQSVVWSDEMAQAFGVCGPLLADGDRVAARMAFREAYTALVAKNRDAKIPANWTQSMGHDPRGREASLREAVEKGRLTYRHAQSLCPTLPPMVPNIQIAMDRAARNLQLDMDAKRQSP